MPPPGDRLHRNTVGGIGGRGIHQRPLGDSEIHSVGVPFGGEVQIVQDRSCGIRPDIPGDQRRGKQRVGGRQRLPGQSDPCPHGRPEPHPPDGLGLRHAGQMLNKVRPSPVPVPVGEPAGAELHSGSLLDLRRELHPGRIQQPARSLQARDRGTQRRIRQGGERCTGKLAEQPGGLLERGAQFIHAHTLTAPTDIRKVQVNCRLRLWIADQ